MHVELIALWIVATLGGVPQAPPASPARAERTITTRFTIDVPHEEAELKVGDTVYLVPRGARRVLDLPTPGSIETLTYEFEVSWKPNPYTVVHRKLSVEFKPGGRVNVDLTSETPGDRAEVIYVPTPPDIVTRMVRLATVRKDDVVFELGCGDARLLIAAVKEGGATKGVGVDIDFERVTESIANVRKAGVADRIAIRHGDIFDDTVTAGLEDATVVMLYMSDELNLLLRPKLLKALKPGARIVSHRFTMGDWTPDRTEEITGEDGATYRLHLWIVKSPNK